MMIYLLRNIIVSRLLFSSSLIIQIQFRNPDFFINVMITNNVYSFCIKCHFIDNNIPNLVHIYYSFVSAVGVSSKRYRMQTLASRWKIERRNR